MTIAILILLIVNTLLILFVYVQTNNRAQEQDRIERNIREEMTANRKELGDNLGKFSEQFLQLTKMNEEKLERVRDTLQKHLQSLQEDNHQQLEKMRETVDEKLQTTLEKRLGDSFKLVSDRLEQVHKGLGEMQNLATGVGDLKKVLTNVKTRGTWGEIQLENLLDQILTPDQYEKNVATKKGSRDPVEFAIKLPGQDDRTVYIPIDAKFPKEDYERLIAAQEQADPVAVEEFAKAIENRIKAEAKKIREKYIDPPNTTDFGILYLPIEGLYAEVLRRPGLTDILQREYRVNIASPTTIAAYLNALQMGFRTLAVEKRASEVWTLLGTVKKEFGKFGDILDKTQKKLQEASNTIEQAGRKSRNIERKLGKVQELPSTPQEEIQSADEFEDTQLFDDSPTIR